MKLEATFEITRWEPVPYDEPRDGPLARVTVGKTYAGALAGLRGKAVLDHGRIALEVEFAASA